MVNIISDLNDTNTMKIGVVLALKFDDLSEEIYPGDQMFINY